MNYYPGLDLWICQKIVSMHRGTIRYSSEGSAMGGTFIVELPLFAKVITTDCNYIIYPWTTFVYIIAFILV